MKDEEIIELYWNRDQRAIRETQNSYQRYCGKIAGNILASFEDREECLNDTWLNAWNSIPPQRPESLKAYVGRITRNLCLNRIKHDSAGKRSTGEADASFEELAELESFSEDSVEAQISAKAIAGEINAFLAAQPADRRKVFVRRYFYFDSIQEIAIKHMNADPPSMLALNPSLPPELERITLKAMCSDIAQRYQSANELLADLEHFLQEQLKPAEPEDSAAFTLKDPL